MPELKFKTIDGTTLHYVREGREQATPLVFINSLGTDLRIWNAVATWFANCFMLIRYDKRGHGLSDCPPGPYTIRQHTSDLAGLLEQLQVASAVLIGVSVGGMIAMDYAINYPQRVRALVLSDTAAKIGTIDLWNERISLLRENGMAYLAGAILERWFSPVFARQHPAAYHGYFNMLTRTPLEGYIATCEAIRDADLSEAVRSIQHPVLVLCGAEDGATPPEVVRGLAKALPNASFDVLEHAGHIPSIEQPAVLTAKIDRFLKEIEYD